LKPDKLVKRDLKNIKENNGLLGLITGDLSYGTLMEITYNKIFHNRTGTHPGYLIITNGHENHPWLKYHSTKIFTDFKSFEDWISISCKYNCGGKMNVVSVNEKMKFDMYLCNKCDKSWTKEWK